jgi:hypothetical protein
MINNQTAATAEYEFAIDETLKRLGGIVCRQAKKARCDICCTDFDIANGGLRSY